MQTLTQTQKLQDKHFKQPNNTLDFQKLKQHLSQQHKLQTETIKTLIQKFRKSIKDEPSLLRLGDPITIVGDIHGQYQDLLKVLCLSRQYQTNKKQKILFLGDYVDRGINSVQVIILLMFMKVELPTQVFLLRGNHESRTLASVYNFQRQCLEKYSQDIYQRIMDAFDALPLAAIISDNIFCVHGGISSKINAINNINRFRQIPESGQFCDLLWADPIPNQDGRSKKDEQFNVERGCSVFFTKSLTDKFFKNNKVSTIIRAHEVFLQGYKQHFWNPNSDLPTVITIFSAPNYCNTVGNLASIVKIQKGQIQIRQFKQVTIKNKLTQKLQVFAWSLPQMIRVVNHTFNKFINRFCEKHFKELKNLDDEMKLQCILGYCARQGKKPCFKIKGDSKIIKKYENNDQQHHMYHRTLQFHAPQHPKAFLKDQNNDPQ